jgi:Gas vesicle synthesis protein GvpO
MASNGKQSSGNGKQSSGNRKQSSGSRRSTRNRDNGRANPAEVARAARTQLAQLTGRPAESVLGLRHGEEGWKVAVEVVELSRIPNSTDLLGCYEVTLDEDGELVGYERVSRYQRGQGGGGER